ncbi:MAG: lytic transglycosylase domain-containing protein [Pseudomonadota bacterium]
MRRLFLSSIGIVISFVLIPNVSAENIFDELLSVDRSKVISDLFEDSIFDFSKSKNEANPQQLTPQRHNVKKNDFEKQIKKQKRVSKTFDLPTRKPSRDKETATHVAKRPEHKKQHIGHTGEAGANNGIPEQLQQSNSVAAPPVIAAQETHQETQSPLAVNTPPATSLSPATAAPLVNEEAAQAEFTADEVLQYLLTLQMPPEDKANLKKAINLFYKKDFEAGLIAASKIKRDITRKIAKWYYYRSEEPHASAEDIKAFYVANSNWPDHEIIRQRAEQSLFGTPPKDLQEVHRFFKGYKSITAQGNIVLGSTYFLQGKLGFAKRYMTKAWRDASLTEEHEQLLLKNFHKLLTTQDLQYRIDQLLAKNNKTNIPRAEFIAGFLGDEVQRVVSTRAAIMRRQASTQNALNALSQVSHADVGVNFSKIQYYRRIKQHNAAFDLLQKLPYAEPQKFTAPKQWWREKHRQIRIALRQKKYGLAYKIAKNHGQLSGKNYADAEFLSGWIALQYLSNPAQAKSHFLALYAAAIQDFAKARSLYWLARTAYAMRQTGQARSYFQKAAKHNFTYYGQMAQNVLKADAHLIIPARGFTPKEQDVKRFFLRERVKAISITYHAGLETLTPLFILSLANSLDNRAELVILAKMARVFGYPALSVRVAKIAKKRGYSLPYYAYPVDLIAEQQNINNDPRVPNYFVYALAHQESEFNVKAKSPVGAMGLMQIMPATAREIAEKHNFEFSLNRLATDGEYGLRLGVAHIGDLLQNYNGSFILTLVAYNAGPRRVKEWIQYYGDPRTNSVDVIDWVENIPFTETRNYVKKIMTGVQIYRSYLNQTPMKSQLFQDLNHGNITQESRLQRSSSAFQ